MSAVRLSAQPHRCRGIAYEGGDAPGGCKSNNLRNGSRGRCAAERAILEVHMTLRVVMVRAMFRRGHRVGGTKFQQKRRPARRHEPDRDVGSKQQRRQQYDGPRVGSSTIG